MIGSYKYTREEIANKIIKSKKTADGHFYCPKIGKMISLEGEITDKYPINRNNFINKFIFSQNDLNLFLCQNLNTKCKQEVENMLRRDRKIEEVIGNLIEFYNLDDKIENNEYTLGELIDMTMFYIDYKNL